MRNKSLFVLSTLLLLVIGSLILLPTLSFSEGCPPNDTCPQGWEPVPVSCGAPQCDGPVTEGYCIYCKKAQEI